VENPEDSGSYSCSPVEWFAETCRWTCKEFDVNATERQMVVDGSEVTAPMGHDSSAKGDARMNVKKVLILLVFAVVAGAFYYLDLGRYLTLESLKANRVRLGDLRAAHAFLFAAAFMLVYIVQTAFSLPGAAILSLASGAVFGVLQGTLVVVSGATVGAVLAFLVSRTLLREWVVQKFGGRMEGIDRGLRENGLPYLLFLRLVPAFPFFLVNLACGVTGLPLRTYALGTLFGIMPGSLVFVNAGASLAAIESVSQVASPRVLGSFALLGLFALLPAILKALKKRRTGNVLPVERH